MSVLQMRQGGLWVPSNLLFNVRRFPFAEGKSVGVGLVGGADYHHLQTTLCCTLALPHESMTCAGPSLPI